MRIYTDFSIVFNIVCTTKSFICFCVMTFYTVARTWYLLQLLLLSIDNAQVLVIQHVGCSWGTKKNNKTRMCQHTPPTHKQQRTSWRRQSPSEYVMSSESRVLCVN